jgi:hypothetical protein
MTAAARDIEQIQSYLAGRLSEEDELLFQDRLAREPLLVRELEQSLGMRQGLKQLQAEGYFATRAPRVKSSRPGNLMHWLLPLAAAAVVAVVCFNIWWEKGSVLTASPIMGRAADVHFNFVAMRGAERPRLQLPAGGLIELDASPGMLDAKTYRLTLIRELDSTRQSVGSVTGIAVAQGDILRSYVEASRLTPGNYLLLIEPEGLGDHENVEFLFTLVPPAATPAP